MAASTTTPLWKRLVIVLSAVVAGIVVSVVLEQAGVSWPLTIVAGAAMTLLVLLIAAGALRVRLKRGWE
jgi:hypothetical protein